jgi:hypothetical protein
VTLQLARSRIAAGSVKQENPTAASATSTDAEAAPASGDASADASAHQATCVADNTIIDDDKCPVCLQRLEHFFNDDREEWMYRNAVRGGPDNRAFHVSCFRVFTQNPSILSQPPSPEAVHRAGKRERAPDSPPDSPFSTSGSPPSLNAGVAAVPIDWGAGEVARGEEAHVEPSDANVASSPITVSEAKRTRQDSPTPPTAPSAEENHLPVAVPESAVQDHVA